MILIQIPKDIRSYEPKFLGPFTVREGICIAIAGAIMLGGVAIEKYLFQMDSVSYIPPAIPAMIPIFFGWGERLLNMKPEVYLRTVFIQSTMVPKYRPFKTHNFYDVREKKYSPSQDEETEKTVKPRKKKNRELRKIPDELKAYD